jgi:RNA polymerase sigma-70 factor (ECF subfamily)
VNRSADNIARMYDQRAKDVLRYIARRTPDPEVAVDLLAETFAQAIARRRSFRGRSDEELVGWIFAIARSQLSDYWRRGRYERTAMERLGVDRPALSDEEYDRVEQLMDLHELRDLLAEEVERLPSQQRIVLRLRIVDELSYPEVAAAIGTSEQTARARVSRGLSALRKVAVVQELHQETRNA